MASLTTKRAAGGLSGVDNHTLREGPPSSTVKIRVRHLKKQNSISLIRKTGCGSLSMYVCIFFVVGQRGATSNGFLSSTEYSLWESSMKLKEDEAHPTLKQSHFMSLPSDPPPQVSLFFYCLFFISLSFFFEEHGITMCINKEEAVVNPF